MSSLKIVTEKNSISDKNKEFKRAIEELRNLEGMLNRYADPHAFIRNIQKQQPYISEMQIWNRFDMLKRKINAFTFVKLHNKKC